jgi:hypothetical protein
MEIYCCLKGRDVIALIILIYALAPLAVMKSGTVVVSSLLAQTLYLGRALGAPAAPTGTKTVIIQMFEWTWNSIATECTQYIGPAGKRAR